MPPLPPQQRLHSLGGCCLEFAVLALQAAQPVLEGEHLSLQHSLLLPPLALCLLQGILSLSLLWGVLESTCRTIQAAGTG